MAKIADLQPRRKGTAVWKQIQQVLLAEIVDGSVRPGDRLPSESALTHRFSVNRLTVRRALAELSAQDLLRIENGRGAFVTAKALRYNVDKRRRSVEVMLRDNRDITVKVLEATRVPADVETAEALKLEAGSTVWDIHSLSIIDGQPAILAHHFFPAERFPDFYKRYRSKGSIDSALATYGVKSTRDSMVVLARLAETKELELLGEQWPAPVLSVTSLYIDQKKRPVDLGRALYPGNRIDLQIGQSQ